MKNTKLRLIILNFLEFAVWGAYLTSQGRYLREFGMESMIGWFYSIQGIVSIFMPALVGILADKWDARKMLGLCHAIAAAAMLGAGWYGVAAGANVQFGPLFALYSLSVAFFMPTLALTNSVAYTLLEREGYDTVKDYPPIRIWGTIGFILSMWAVDLLGFQPTAKQYIVSGAIGVVMAVYSFLLPACKAERADAGKQSFTEALGLKAFTLFKDYKMAIFFFFSFLLGAALQISNGFANTYLGDFGEVEIYKSMFVVNHSNILISLSQISETFCILLIPFFLHKFGIKKVMLLAMVAWGFRFAFLGLGNPGGGVWLFLLSMIVYGVAFDFFNISGSLFVDKNTTTDIRSSAQGLFMLTTNGIGASVGSLAAQAVVTRFTGGLEGMAKIDGWRNAWYIFAAYAFILALIFAITFKYKHNPEDIKQSV